MSVVLQENYHLFVEINHLAGRSPWLDTLMIVGANLALFLWPLLLLALWGRPCWWRARPFQAGEQELLHERRATVLWMVGACLLAYLFNLGLEHLIFEPRPFVSHVVHLLITHPADASFPSDHAAVSFALVGMLLFSLPALRSTVGPGQRHRWCLLRVPLLLLALSLLLACWIGFARVFVGVHYPGDILGGALSGLCAAAVMTGLRRRLDRLTCALLRLAEQCRLA